MPLVDRRRADRAVLDRAHRRARCAAPKSNQHGTDDPLRVVFFGLLILGVPVAFSIGLSALATILYEGLPLAVVFQQMTSGMNVFSFLAIPFFIFAGELMLYGGIADSIVDFAKSLVGHVRGGLGMTQRRGLHAVRRRLGLAGRRRLGDGRGDDPDDEAGGLRRRLRGQRDDPRGAGRRADADRHNMIIYSLAAGGKVSIAALILAGLLPALILTFCNLAAAYARRGASAAIRAGKLPGLGASSRAPSRRRCPGLLRRRPHPRRHPVGRVHRDRVGGGRGRCTRSS